METLDEVIKALEVCMVDDAIESEGVYLATDALHYLKVLKDILDPLKVKKISHEITCPQCNSVIAILLPESNPPLTWQELKTMEGKPVWVETEYYPPRWAVITDANDNRVRFVGKQLLDSEGREDLGKTWQAFRKERE